MQIHINIHYKLTFRNCQLFKNAFPFIWQENVISERDAMMNACLTFKFEAANTPQNWQPDIIRFKTFS